MGVLTLLRRRLRTHPLALTAVVVAALMSMVVVATLQLLSGVISDAGARSSLGAGRSGGAVAASTVSVGASVKPESLVAADAVVRGRLLELADEVEVTRVAYPTVRGLRGGDARERVQIADIVGLQDHAELVSGRWAARSSSPAVIEVALPAEAAKALSLSPGKTVALTNLTETKEKDLTVTVVGTYRVRDRDATLWLDDPLSPVGVRQTDYTTYGPLVLAPGVFDTGVVGQTQITWRASTRFDEATASSVADVRRQLTQTLSRLRAEVGDTRGESSGSSQASAVISGGTVDTGLTEQLDSAALVAARIRASLLTPTVLLILLGAASLVMAARLLAALRADETRLMRTRGMSTRQVIGLSLADSGLIVAVGAVGALVAAPFLTRVIGNAAGVDLGAGGYADALRNGQLWVALATMALLATLVVVITSARSGATSGSGGGSSEGSGRTPAALQFASGSGFDLALIGIGVLAVLQLRRYDVAGSATVDPLTIAAPACVIAGLSVLCLRLLPGATRQVERASVGHVGLDRAWGAWQLSRRLAAQGGTILLILLCVAMGALALSHVATADRALADQSAFETGAPIRIDTPLGSALADRAAGSPDRAMPVLRETTDLRSVKGVTVLGVDATRAGAIMDPRPDTLAGHTWNDLMATLSRARPKASVVPLPDGTRALTFSAAMVARSGSPTSLDGITSSAQVLVVDGRGNVTGLSAGTVSPRPAKVTATLPAGESALPPPVSIVGFSAALPGYFIDYAPPDLVAGLAVTNLLADGKPLAGTDKLTDHSRGIDLRLTAEASTAATAPVIMTRALASDLDLGVGGSVPLTVAGRSIPAQVAALIDSVPTAVDPTRAVLIDLPTLYVTTDRPGVDKGWPTLVPTPREWWLAPTGHAASIDVLEQNGLPNGALVDRVRVEATRQANPVNAGMQAAMLLVTGAALVLAAVGFAATTASLARTRHHENAILLALGMPPGRIRRVLTIERVCVVVLTVLVGVAMGAAAAYVVVPFLVGGDGHAQVPSVLVVIPWGRLALLAAAITAVLSTIGVLVLRRTGSDLATELRMGESR